MYWLHVGKDFHNIFGCEQVQNILWGTILSTQREETQVILIIKLSHNFLPTVKRNKIHTYITFKIRGLFIVGRIAFFFGNNFYLKEHLINYSHAISLT